MSNSIIAMFNKFGAIFCEHALAMLIQSSILILVLLIIDLFLRKRIRAVFRYCIWLLVFVKLVIPPTFSLPTGIGYWQDDYWPTDSIAVETTDVPTADHAELLKAEYSVVPSELPSLRPASSVEIPVADASVVVPASPSINWQAIVLIGWFLGVLALVVLLIQRAWFVRRLIAQSEPAEIELSSLLSDCCRRLGTQKRIELRISQNSLSPAACGLFKPKIILPSSLLAHFSTDKLRTVLLHELAHIKRGDLWINFIQTMLQIFYFYNPLLWLANVKVRRVREQAVDEMVLVLLGDKAKTYSSTLVDIAEIAFIRPTLGLRMIGVVESKKALTSRIRYIVSRPFPKTAKLGIVGLLGVIIIAAVMLPMARAEKDDTAVQSSRKTPSVEIGQPNEKEMPTTISGVVTDKLGRPRGNVYITTSLNKLRDVTRTNEHGQFTLELIEPEQKNWIAYSHASRSVGLFTIPQDYADQPIRVILDFSVAEAEGRIIGSDGKGLANRKVELITNTKHGFTYYSECYRKTDKYGNYRSSVPCGSSLTIQARLADGDGAEQKYVTETVALSDSQIFFPIPTLVLGNVQPEEADDGKVLYSGRVVNEEGQPIPGVKVKLSFRMSGWMSIWVRSVMTDERGRWKRRLPKELSNLKIGLLHPEYIKQSWQKPSSTELLNGTNVMVMKRGLTIRGIVKNEQGEPIENALVDTGGGEGTTVYGEVIENHTTPRTLADGSFSVGGLAVVSKDIIVSAVGYAPQVIPINVEDGMESIEVCLKSGKTHVGQVVDIDGNPIEGVKIVIRDWRVGNKRNAITRITKTDSRGYFKIENLPDEGNLKLGFGKRDSGLLGFSKEIPEDVSLRDKIVMYKTPVFAGKVVDAETGAVIKNFTHTIGIDSAAFGDSISWSRSRKEKVTSEDGTFSRSWVGYGVTYPFDGLCCLLVEAKGYLPEAARPMKLGEKYEPCIVRLTKAEPLKGIVVDNKGNPAAKAQVGWVGPKRFAFIKNGKFDTTGFSYQAEPIVNADSKGIFELPPSREQSLIVVVHKTGYASVESKDFKDGSQIRLTPWARIEGTIVSSEQNRGEFVLSIYQAKFQEESKSQQMRWMFDRTSFSGNNFVIDFVPSTPLNIGRVVQSGQYNPTYIDPQPGETCEVRFGDEGIIAAGKKMPSLLGKPLPDLTGIEIKFSPKQYKGQMILVCFWDMNQRPSRYCIRELAKHAEELYEKEVTILAIQTSKVDENKLDRWGTEYNIPFQVGMVQDDAEKTKFGWGIKFLPWLILTDDKHVVQAEGFAASELDQKVHLITQLNGDD
ncbi:MAG: M48 family metalloprotease [Planctomycetes bacterium]|nr:M48 family metalloprotease [Planctomycetota bacterium]